MDIPSYLIGAIKGAGSAGVKYVVVEELPTTGEEGTIYLVPKTTSETDNVYNEYMYINNDWELIGDTQADLSNYQPLIDSSHKLSSDLVDDTNNTNLFVTSSEKSTWGGKQDALVSGTNIKTINNTSILGEGNIDISSDANVYYLGKTNLYNTEENALDLNSLKIGRYYFKHDSNNNTLWVKATYKGSEQEPTTRTLQITLFDDFSSTNPKKPVVIQNTIMLYIDKEFDENTVVLSSLGSITSSFKDDNHGLVNNYFTISLGTVSILLGTKNYEKCNLTSQYSTMPTATSDTVGKIVQYTGTTNNTYTNGYFYIGTTDGAVTPTYGWSNINVQSSSGGSNAKYVINVESYLVNGRLLIKNYNTTENKTTLQSIYDNYSNVNPDDIKVYDSYFHGYFSANRITLIGTTIRVWYNSPYNEINTNYAGYWMQYNEVCIYHNINDTSVNGTQNTIYSPSSNYNDFVSISNTNSWTPTSNYGLVHKKYVDDMPTTYSNYDASKTQVLKNINGTLTWVDE